MAFFFDTRGSKFSFIAGQYANFKLINPPQTDEKGNDRDFSIASSPNNKDEIMIATRMRGSAFKNSLNMIPFGTKVKVEGPNGYFTLQKDSSKPAVFLAGGIGVTPMRSMIEFATQERLPHKIYLFYSNKTPADAVFLDDLERWSKDNPNFKFIPTLTEYNDPSWHHELGRINENMIRKYVDATEINHAIYYASGPASMVGAMIALLKQMNISEEHIKTEEFSGY